MWRREEKGRTRKYSPAHLLSMSAPTILLFFTLFAQQIWFFPFWWLEDKSQSSNIRLPLLHLLTVFKFLINLFLFRDLNSVALPSLELTRPGSPRTHGDPTASVSRFLRLVLPPHPAQFHCKWKSSISTKPIHQKQSDFPHS